ncbi:MAG: F0F1 ATP synthase subunit epsilon [Candidatus Margulisiibacteriota bacterium]
MNLKILSPDKIIVDKPADFVSLMMESGSVGILHGHVPLAGKLVRSYVKFDHEGKEEKVPVDGGYAWIMPDSVTVFTAGRQ